MDIKQMQYFVEIVNSNFNLSRAAEKLHITQPSLSMLITELESNYKIKLLTKQNSRYSGLTAEGKILYDEAQIIISELSRLEYKLANIRNKHYGTIKVGIPPIIISLFFNKSLSEFMSRYPDVNLEIIEEGANVLERKLRNNEIDFAILVGSNETTKDIVSTEICCDSIAVYFRNDHKFASRKFLTLKDLSDEELILLSDDFVLHTVIKSKFQEIGISPKVLFTSGQWDLLTQMTHDRNVITILPKKLETKLQKEFLKVLDFRPKITWSISLAKSTKHSDSSTSILFEEFIGEFYSNPNNI